MTHIIYLLKTQHPNPIYLVFPQLEHGPVGNIAP